MDRLRGERQYKLIKRMFIPSHSTQQSVYLEGGIMHAGAQCYKQSENAVN